MKRLPQELHDVIAGSQAKYWIYGHHHTNTPAFKIGDTTLLTNQLQVCTRQRTRYIQDKCADRGLRTRRGYQHSYNKLIIRH